MGLAWPNLSQYLVSLSLSLGAMGLMAGYWVKLSVGIITTNAQFGPKIKKPQAASCKLDSLSQK